MSAIDRFASYAPSWSTPSPGRVPVTPSDAEPLPFVTRSLKVTGAGNVRAACADGSIVPFAAAAGETIPGQFVRVFLTGTTATGILAEK